VKVTLEKGWNLVSLSGSKIVKFKENQCGEKLIAFVYLNDQSKYVSLVKAKSILEMALQITFPEMDFGSTLTASVP